MDIPQGLSIPSGYVFCGHGLHRGILNTETSGRVYKITDVGTGRSGWRELSNLLGNSVGYYYAFSKRDLTRDMFKDPTFYDKVMGITDKRRLLL